MFRRLQPLTKPQPGKSPATAIQAFQHPKQTTACRSNIQSPFSHFHLHSVTSIGLYQHPIMVEKFNPQSLLRAGRNLPDPWARREAWRYTGPFTRINRFRGFFPGLGIATVAFTVYCAAEYMFFPAKSHGHGHDSGHGEGHH
ncbi:hypothetical protein TWF102_000271 [Orbilia oligospora]|uniref:NADH-ubiquinone oxidoreductase B12 subunit n=1 Tax=Orbilia oligospora TaxID=2813651 RepID=A0A7C8JEU3_ORBOL|nr:hypothetical protein TWF706_011968 [Orbilia oligospora]KAF3107351.1 hypothetical protein TWF102_000271 [Orbilia oligospora]KAF3116034.1 hypothetical protein TWF103_010258 [Orbilia oligospora]KAF3138154.1 hypothetical protein TWF703_004681 [Orbilia oligospora]